VPEIRRVVLNALFLDPAVSGGSETYLRGLAPALAAAHPDTSFAVVTTRSGAAALRAGGWAGWSRVVSLPCEEGQRLRRQWAEQVLLPALARRLRADVLHSLASVAPIRSWSTPHVVTVHDVTFFRMRTFNAVTTFGMRQVVARAARNADALISVTAAARDEICAEVGLAPESFTVVHHGSDPPAAIEPAPDADVRARLGLSRDARLVLCVGAKRPHKNQELLVRALTRLPDDVVLVLAGHPEPYDDRLRALADDLGVTARVRFPGYVAPEDLERLWEMAACAAFPTRAEGFGLPLLEAMRRRVPVAASDIAVLREVGGEVPHFFDPDRPDEAAVAIAAAMRDGDGRAEAAAARAARFTWGAAAAGTWSAYERALARGRG
jgi:glycosyltransferase involved in cell wall biosynthesis